ncbi:MAG: hypothetical protein GXP05_01540 [Alphaproteobacteria bacterium]|nr:hypothetical protein [Alphaproteobacteria bacterium]
MTKVQRSLRFIEWRRIKRETMGILIFGIILLAGYIWFLNHQQNRAERYFANLKMSAPQQYLNEIKGVAGYNFYLREYRRINGYDRLKSKAPDFLLGRWSIASTAKRVSASYTTPECLNPLLIENGRITLPNTAGPINGVSYKLVANDLVVALPDSKKLEIGLVSTGILLHHLELKFPGQLKTSFGYSCR